METRVNILTTFATLIPNEGPRVLKKGPGKGLFTYKFQRCVDKEKVFTC